MDGAAEIALVWFRNDLRLDDNPALRRALEAGRAVVPLYIHDPEAEGEWAPGAASNAWRHRSLEALDRQLRLRGSHLRFFIGPSEATLRSLAAATGARAVYWNRRYEPRVEARDAQIKRSLRADGIEAHSADGALLFEPWRLQTKAGGPFKVFTPFWRAALADWRPQAPWDAPERIAGVDVGPEGVFLHALRLVPRRGWDAGFWDTWCPGEAGARDMLDAFLEGALHGYGAQRDRPDRVGSSRLSPHLHFGEIAPWRVVHALQAQRGTAPSGDIDALLRQLGWREFAHHLLHHFPQTPAANFNPRFDRFAWATLSPERLRAWQRGRTGVPIVDAGMRELWHTGWMHNRVRMIAASYLTKHLRGHWLEGARWFWRTLVDADLANNTLGWQWVAGTGADAAPYFRVFNPVAQARRFDPRGEYIARWVPELAPLPLPLRFAPWEDAARLRAVAPGYPTRPLVDLEAGRQRALAAFRGLADHDRDPDPAGTRGVRTDAE